MKIRYLFYLALLAFVVSCKPEVNEFTPSKGGADFTTYVAVGNSLTAGYADGALYKSGQSYSWANILGQQFATVGGGAFVQPVVNSEYGVELPVPHPEGKFVLEISVDCLGVPGLGPVVSNGVLDPWTNHIDYAVNNVGVPGAKVGHLLFPGYGNPANLTTVPPSANPYFIRFATSPDITVAAQAKAMAPTFFSLWIGNNDVLGYATSGGADEVITPEVEFTTYYNGLVQTLIAGGTKGVLANIPGVTNTAFFTTIPYNVIVFPEDGQWMVDALNAAYGPYNTAMEQMEKPYRIVFSLDSANAMVIMDPNMDVPPTLQFRQMTKNELALLTLPQDSIKCEDGPHWGSQTPVPNRYILTESEIANVTSATAVFNNIIKQAADNNGLAFVDFNAIMVDISANGLIFDGITFSTKFVTGNLFSLDGIHLTPQGNALVANYFIDAINAQYGAQIPKVSVANYPPIVFP
ncbi:MAG: SGNH/GDSL hydrolase family protein [Bacteroidales bacterium]|jgi:lysophospholipase L1-like esterase